MKVLKSLVLFSFLIFPSLGHAKWWCGVKFSNGDIVWNTGSGSNTAGEAYSKIVDGYPKLEVVDSNCRTWPY